MFANYKYMKYTYLHRKCLKYYIEKKSCFLSKEEFEELMKRAKVHDLDKQTLYLVWEKKDASAYHRKTASHHIRPTTMNKYDILESIFDFECAGLSKPDKPLNAYDTIMKYYSEYYNIYKPYLQRLGMDYSYQAFGDEDLNWFKGLTVSEDLILDEIGSYLRTVENNVQVVEHCLPDDLYKSLKSRGITKNERSRDEILQNGLNRAETYIKVIKSIQSGMSEAESCRHYEVNLGMFRNWCRGNYTKKNVVDESFMMTDDFFSWKDALIYAVTKDKSIVATSNFDEAWAYLKTTLTECEAWVFERRFIDSMTLEAVAKLSNVSSERVRQTEVNALRKLRHPYRAKILLYGTDYIKALEELKRNAEKERANKFNVDFSSEVAYIAKRNLAVQTKDSGKVLLNLSLDDLLLSGRTYNSLKKAGINDLKDIVEYERTRGIYRIRNLGQKSLTELQGKLQECGCDIQLRLSK